MKPLKLLIPVLFFTFSKMSVEQNCSVLKNNSFTYKLAKDDVLIQFQENKHVEYHQDKKYYIKSNVEWVSDCEYFLIVQDVNLPKFPFKLKSRIHIKITKIKGDKIYYKSSVEGRTWEGKMTKIKQK